MVEERGSVLRYTLGPTEKFDKITTFEKLKMDVIVWVEWKGQNVGKSTQRATQRA